MNGKVKRIFYDKNFGFILGIDGIEYFFHKSDNIIFGELSEGDKIEFEVVQANKGPRARNIIKVLNSS